MKLRDLPFEYHIWRFRFTFFPVKRIEKDENGYISHKGYYWWRIIFEVKVGINDEWTAYSHHNDHVELEGKGRWGRPDNE